MSASVFRWLPVACLALLAVASGGLASRLQNGQPEPTAFPPLPSNALWLESRRVAAFESARLTEEARQEQARVFTQFAERTLAPWRASVDAARESALESRRLDVTLLWGTGGICAALALLLAAFAFLRVRQETAFAETLEEALDSGRQPVLPPGGAGILGPCHMVLTRLLRSQQNLRVQVNALRHETPAPAPSAEKPRPSLAIPPAPRPAAAPEPMPPPLVLAPAMAGDAEAEEKYFFLELASHKERRAS